MNNIFLKRTFAVAAFFCCLFFVAFYDIKADEPTDIIFLINTSDEMNLIDPERAAVNAVSRFVRDSGATVRVGVVTSSRQLPLRLLENEYVSTGLSATILTMDYTGGENFATAVQSAENMAAAQNAVIIHVTHENGETLNITESGTAVRTVFANNASAADLAARFRTITNNHRANIAEPIQEPEPTPEPTPQPTPEPTPQPTPQPEPEPTPQPTPQPEPEPTPQPTPEPPPVETPVPTPEPTPQPTLVPEILETPVPLEISEGIYEIVENEEEYPTEEIFPTEEEILSYGDVSTHVDVTTYGDISPNTSGDIFPDTEGDISTDGDTSPDTDTEEPSYTALLSIAVISFLAAAISVYRLIKEVI